MSMVTYPLNNIEYTAEDAELFHSTRTSGVYATDSFDYSVTSADNSIVIGTGIAWIKNRQFSGKVVAQKEPMSLDMGLPDPTYPRIDAVVIQFNSNKNATEIVVKNGAASSFPIAPEVVRTESLYELHLYHVRREAGSLSISAPNITDLRNNNAYCGLMSDSITQAVDSTLSKNGVAADAAAVGNALAKKAPAGYGLGVQGSSHSTSDPSTVDSFKNNGWVQYYNEENVPLVDGVASSHACLIRVEFFNWNFGRQTAYTITGVKLERTYSSGTWTPWDYINPPMVLGTEYRTTERWLGKAVYTIAFGTGQLPNNSVLSLTDCYTATNIIRASGATNNGARMSLPTKWQEWDSESNTMLTKEIGLMVASWGASIFTNYDASSVNATIQIWYTKD